MKAEEYKLGMYVKVVNAPLDYAACATKGQIGKVVEIRNGTDNFVKVKFSTIIDGTSTHCFAFDELVFAKNPPKCDNTKYILISDGGTVGSVMNTRKDAEDYSVSFLKSYSACTMYKLVPVCKPTMKAIFTQV